MLARFRGWLNSTALTDAVERRQAALFQGMLLTVIGACVVGLAISSLTNRQPIISAISYSVIVISSLASLVLLRRGQFAPAILLTAAMIELGIGLSLFTSGFSGSAVSLLAFSAPVALAGLLLGRRGVLVAVGLAVALVGVTAALTIFAPALVGFMPVGQQHPFATVVTFTLVIAVLGLFIDRFSTSLREALHDARGYAAELEHLRGSLETTVAERTASLQAALGDVAQREASLAQTLAALQESRSAVQALSAPILPVLPGVLVAPLIGDVDSERASVLTSTVLAAVEGQGVHHVIFDITGVPVVDTHVAQVLLKAASAVRLLGAKTLLVGVRPEVAQTLVSLGIDLGDLATYSSLREAVGSLLRGNWEYSR